MTLADGRVFAADLVVGAIGVRPTCDSPRRPAWSSDRAAGSRQSETNQTNDPDIYAVGDAAEKSDAVSHATSLIALANVANRQGRRVADHIAGRLARDRSRRSATAIVKVFDLVAATVGWNVAQGNCGALPRRQLANSCNQCRAFVELAGPIFSCGRLGRAIAEHDPRHAPPGRNSLIHDHSAHVCVRILHRRDPPPTMKRPLEHRLHDICGGVRVGGEDRRVS